jgi:DNA-binding FadR family transcriptional regulator
MDGQVRFRQVERRTVADEVREALAASIRSGTLAPGVRLPTERELSLEFGVARTSVREAIQSLVSLGLLERRGNRPHVVERLPDLPLGLTDQRKRRVQELFEVRRIVEVPIARFAAGRATDQQRGEIRRIARGFDHEMSLNNFRQLDREFHTAVAQACGNRTLGELHAKVLENLFRSEEADELLYAESNQQAVREIIRTAVTAHRRIALAIADGEPDQAAAAAERHLDDVESQMTSRLV